MWSVGGAAEGASAPEGYIKEEIAEAADFNGYAGKDDSAKYAFTLSNDVDLTPGTNTAWSASKQLFKKGSYWFAPGAEGSVMLSYSGGASGVFYTSRQVGFYELDRLSFENISTRVSGGAINVADGLTLSGIDGGDAESAEGEADFDVVFSNCASVYTDARKGGAIATTGSESIVNVCHNGEVIFVENYVQVKASDKEVLGGAVYAENVVEFCCNRAVVFHDNDVEVTSYGAKLEGGALYAKGRATFDENLRLYVTGNKATTEQTSSSARGGAFYASGGLVIARNGEVIFAGNEAEATSSAYGGAIYANDGLEISNNDLVSFSGNRVAARSSQTDAFGGAIYALGDVVISGNKRVIFENNYEQVNGLEVTCRLSAMDVPDKMASMVLSAPDGGFILFKDPVNMVYSSGVVSLNAPYIDENGASQQATGDIIFSGEDAANRLAEIKGQAVTHAELQQSVTSVIDNHIYLYGGSLQVVDGAILKSRGVSAVADSEASLFLRDASLNMEGYQVQLGAGCGVELQGCSVITASRVSLDDSSFLKVSLDESHRTTAALTLTQASLATGALNIYLDRTDGWSNGRYKIITLASGAGGPNEALWNESNVVVHGKGAAVGASFSDLVWEGSSLYYVVNRMEWDGEETGGVWDSSQQKDGVDVYFGNAGSGTVMVVGEVSPSLIVVDNSVDDDYVFVSDESGGKITGDASLVKSGAGCFALDMENDYSGSTLLQEGELRVRHVAALGNTSDLTTVKGSFLVIEAPGEVTLAGRADIGSQVKVETHSTLFVQEGEYYAEKSEINGRLVIQDGVDASGAGELKGNGVVEVLDSSARFSNISEFAGNLRVLGDAASLSVTEGTYATDGRISISGGVLDMHNSNLILEHGGMMTLEAATLKAKNIVVEQGAELVLSETMSEYTLNRYAQSVGMEYNTVVGGVVESGSLTLMPGSYYVAAGTHLCLNGGRLILPGHTEAEQKVILTLESDVEYGYDDKVWLFSGVEMVEFEEEALTIDTLSGQVLTLCAADYFGGPWINEQTLLIYDALGTNVYLQHVGNAVPEPRSSTLALLGLATICLRKKRA